MMYFGPGPMQVSTQQSLLGSPREDDENDDGDELEMPEQAPVFVYDSPSLISRPSTAFRRHLQLDNVEEDDKYLPLDSLQETRSEIALPLRVGNEMLGICTFN